MTMLDFTESAVGDSASRDAPLPKLLSGELRAGHTDRNVQDATT